MREQPEGRVEFQFAARPGICSEEGDWDCDGYMVRVRIDLDEGETSHVRFRVGNAVKAGREARQSGDIAPAQAVAFLLGLARTHSDDNVAEEALGAAVLARDVEVWPALLDLSRDSDRGSEVRTAAIFWLGQEAGAKSTEGLSDLIDADEEDIELREHAIFALSQRDEAESVPALMRIARTHEIGQLRKTALFWLSQSDDPRVIALFEEILSND